MYSGHLIGGPDGGNFIDSTVPKVITWDALALNLDGNDAEPTISVTHGSYTWSDSEKCYNWELIDTKFYTPEEYVKWIRNKYDS